MRMPRRSAGLLALLALALALPASANAGGSHLLKLYKAERSLTLEGDATVDLSCPDGDFAIDGMWRIDQVDQDNDWLGNVLTAVDVLAAYPDATDPSQYHFRFDNTAGGDAQVKLFLTCLGKDTEPAQSHTHSFSIGARQTQPHGPAPPSPPAGTGFFATSCLAGEIAVAPGFEFLSGSGRLVGSRTSYAGAEPPLYRNWGMGFWLTSTATWNTYMRCLPLLSGPGPGGHRHRIVLSTRGGLPMSSPTAVAPGGPAERQVHCGDLYKGMLHAFDTSALDAPYEHFLGMDPRIKTRAYRFFDLGGAPIGVWTGMTCFKDRTT